MPSKGIEDHLNGNCIHNVKSEFVELYYRKKCTLADVMKHFAKWGVTASKQQWKTQITTWGIRKNSHGSDMLFAAQKSRERKRLLGKDTAFIIQGRRRRVREIERTVKRLRSRVDCYEKAARTPEGVSYFTPPYSSPPTGTLPIPGSPAEAHPPSSDYSANIADLGWSTKADSSTYDDSVYAHAANHLWDSLSAGLGSSSQGNLYGPTLLGDPEIFASSIRTFTGHSLTRVADGKPHFNDVTSELARCFIDIQAAIRNYEAGELAAARASWNQGLQLLPQVVSSCHVFLLVYIMRFSVLSSVGAQKLGDFFLSAAHMVGARMLGSCSPIVQMLDVMRRSGQSKGAIIEAGVCYAADELVDTVHSDVICLLFSAHRYLSWIRHDWYGVIHHCQRICDLYEKRNFTSKYDWRLDSLLWQARAYLRLRSFVELINTISTIDEIFQGHEEGMDKFRGEYTILCQEYAEVQSMDLSSAADLSNQQVSSRPPQNLFLMYLLQARN